MNSEAYQTNIQNFLGLNDEHIISTTFYLNQRMNAVNQINSTNVLGFSIFYTDDYDRMFHSLFLPNNGNYDEVTEYTMQVNSLLINIPNFLMHHVNSLSSSESILMIINRQTYISFNTNNTTSLNEFSMKDAIEYNNYFVNNGGDEGTGALTCKGANGCNSSDPIYYCEMAPFTQAGYCKEAKPDCPLSLSKIIVTGSATLDSTQINNYFQMPLLYQFEDSLKNHAMGVKYYLYYRAISNVISENMDLTTSLEIAYALPPVYAMINKLLNPGTYGSSVMMNSTEHDDLIEFLSILRDVYDNDDYRTIIDDIKNDMDNFEGKTVNQILNEIG